LRISLLQVSFVLHCGRAELDLSMEHRQGRLWVGRLSGVPGAFCSGTIAHIQVPPLHWKTSCPYRKVACKGYLDGRWSSKS